VRETRPFLTFHSPIARMGGGASDGSQDRGIPPEEGQADKLAGGPARSSSGHPRAFQIGGPVPGIAVPRAAHNPRCPCVGIS
jgi:hypothetical protein